MPPRPAIAERERVKRTDPDRAPPPGRPARLGHLERLGERLLRTPIEPGAAVDTAERERLLRVLRPGWPGGQQLEQLRGEAGKRQEIQTIVLQHRRQRPRIAGPEELEV